MNEYDPNLFTFLSRDHFESFEAHTSSEEYLRLVRRHVSRDAVFEVGGYWTTCLPRGEHTQIPRQGWKLHVCATVLTAVETLDRLVPFLAAEEVAFKFVADSRMAEVMNNKGWVRSSSGKFLTIYPRDPAQFVRLAAGCDERTRGLEGPFILSDRPYGDSKVVFYRYGVFRGRGELDYRGLRVVSLEAPDGRRVPDPRAAYFQLPEWVDDPFGGAEGLQKPKSVLVHDRYRVHQVLRHSNRGGVYKAEDTRSGNTVVLREARPFVGTSQEPGQEAVALLEKEARLLELLGDLPCVPRLLDRFRDWEHLFLVQEFVDGMPLHHHALNLYVRHQLLGETSAEEYYEEIRRLAGKLVAAMEEVHGRGVILRDFTKANVLLNRRDEVQLVDLEFAHRMGSGEVFLRGGTGGYTSPQQRAHEAPSPADDHFALGALLFDVLFLNASFLELDPGGAARVLAEYRRHHGLPEILEEIVLGLLEADPRRRWDGRRVARALRVWERNGRGPAPLGGGSGQAAPQLPVELAVVGPSALDAQPEAELQAEVEEVLAGVDRYLDHVADFARADRLWPAHPAVFGTSPIGVQHGASGTALYQLRSRGRVAPEVLDWILERLEQREHPPGLFSGLAGAAWVLLDAGRREQAEEILQSSAESTLVHAVPDVYYGSAGWGLANLYFWLRTHKEQFLARAVDTGARLLAAARRDGEGLFWDNDGTVFYGYGHGAAGIAGFLLSLHLVEGSPQFLEAARRALDFELSRAIVDEGTDSMIWTSAEGAPEGLRFPHWRFGSSGIAAVLLRLFAVTGEERYRHAAEGCARACSGKFSNKAAFDQGMAGFGHCYLDAARFLGEVRWERLARHQVRSILLYAIRRPEGIAFPGMEMMRISCDLGTGMAGTALFLHRWLHRSSSPPFFLDELVEERVVAEAEVPEEAGGPALAD